MGYRYPDPPTASELLDATAEPATISVNNGTVTRFPIECYRTDGCVRYGWPWLRRRCETPVDLEAEGYTGIEVSLDDPPAGLAVTGSIDYNIILLTVEAKCAAAEESDAEVRCSIFAVGQSDDGDLKDVVVKGILRIAAGTIQ